MTKSELYLATMLGEYSGSIPPPNTKVEIYLYNLLMSGGTSGGASNPPIVKLTLNPSKELYDIASDSISTIKITTNVTKRTNDIKYIRYYVDDVLINETTENIASGGSFSYEYTPASPITKTTTVKVVVFDGSTDITQSKTITFTGLSYYGTVNESVSIPTESDVLTLQNSILKGSCALTYDRIQVEYGKVLYAYPKTLGKVTKIVDSLNFDYTNSYNSGTLSVNGIDYYYYILIDAMGTDNGYQKFS